MLFPFQNKYLHYEHKKNGTLGGSQIILEMIYIFESSSKIIPNYRLPSPTSSTIFP